MYSSIINNKRSILSFFIEKNLQLNNYFFLNSYLWFRDFVLFPFELITLVVDFYFITYTNILNSSQRHKAEDIGKGVEVVLLIFPKAMKFI